MHKQFPADLATFTEEILNGKLHLLRSVTNERIYWKESAKQQKNFMSALKGLMNLKTEWYDITITFRTSPQKLQPKILNTSPHSHYFQQAKWR